jgi:CO/xanthine dehydrogenase FAD-binding subunit
MRSDPGEFELVAPGTLQAVAALLARNPGEWLPLAGGTDLMVLYAAGKLPARKLVSIWNLAELRRIEVRADEISVGAGSTYTDIREHEIIAREFPMLARVAGWTGGIANQNRGTLGGNIVNASPAADSPPALLAYDATLTLVSATGSRTLPYAEFHLGYKRTALRPGELLYSITLPRAYSAYRSYTRKVGTRNAQAISKVALACLALLDPTTHEIRDIRIGAASLRETPTRCLATEVALRNQPLTPETLPTLVAAARTALATEARPIDDIRSTARYRAAVAANLLEEFLQNLL